MTYEALEIILLFACLVGSIYFAFCKPKDFMIGAYKVNHNSWGGYRIKLDLGAPEKNPDAIKKLHDVAKQISEIELKRSK